MNDRGSYYVLPSQIEPGAIYGTFAGQRILGYPATFEGEEAAPAYCQDIHGCPMHVGAPAMHISGLDMYGKKSIGCYVRHLGRVRYVYAGDRRDRESMWSYEGEWMPEVIARPPRHVRQPKLLHHVEWSPASSFVTLRGIYSAFGAGRAFGPRDVIDSLPSDSSGRSRDYLHGQQHYSAVRRLLEGFIDVSNLPPGTPYVERMGRWQYRMQARR